MTPSAIPESTVVNALSDQIGRAVRAHALESHYPGADSDASESRMNQAKKRFTELRKIREQYEDLMYGDPT